MMECDHIIEHLISVLHSYYILTNSAHSCVIILRMQYGKFFIRSMFRPLLELSIILSAAKFFKSELETPSKRSIYTVDMIHSKVPMFFFFFTIILWCREFLGSKLATMFKPHPCVTAVGFSNSIKM